MSAAWLPRKGHAIARVIGGALALLTAHTISKNIEHKRAGDAPTVAPRMTMSTPTTQSISASDLTDSNAGLLRASEIRYRRLFDTAQDGILLLNADTGQIEDVNPFLIDLLRYSHAEFIGKKLWEVGAFADIAESKRLFSELRRTGYVRYENLPLRTAAGANIEVEFISSTYDCDGTTTIQCNIRDISERLRIEARLRATEEAFRDLVEQAIVGIFIIQDGAITYANLRAAEIVDSADVRMLIGSTFLDWVAAEHRPKVAGLMAQLTGGDQRSMVFDFFSMDSSENARHIAANASFAVHAGAPAVICMVQDISEKTRAEEAIRRYIEEIKESFMSTVKVATIISEMRDPYTVGHERRVAEIACAIGTELGFDGERLAGLRVAGHLHDVGKISVPSEILSKPGRISAVEYELVKGHAQASYDILKDVKFPWPIAEIALQHHERIDGSGYPNKLKGNEILFEARILAVADVVEAMSSHRPYRAGLGIDAALAEISRGRGSVYDPDVVDACLRIFQESKFVLPASHQGLANNNAGMMQR